MPYVDDHIDGLLQDCCSIALSHRYVQSKNGIMQNVSMFSSFFNHA